ncbi:MAG: alpha/beta hydrolase [Deltaproteobacteria bacterium]
MNWTSWGEPEMAAPGALPVVFLPGWGCSGRMLSLCQPERTWWSVADQIDPSSFFTELDAFLSSKGWPRIILVGWSLGARLALEFASRHPGRIDTLVLLSLRRQWPAPEIAAIREELLIDPAAFLEGFYRKCFLGHKKAWRQFVDRQMESELSNIDLQVLKAGLALLQTPLAPVIEPLRQSDIPLARVWLLHGENDIIAPFPERMLLAGARHFAFKQPGWT